MAQEAFVVIEAPISEEAEAILWHDMDPGRHPVVER